MSSQQQQQQQRAASSMRRQGLIQKKRFDGIKQLQLYVQRFPPLKILRETAQREILHLSPTRPQCTRTP